jgi:hypothetical protein
MRLQINFKQKSPDSKPMWSQYESGQAIVLIVFVMVGLLGMLGLAIDGGGLFFLNRDAQNATDAAVVAASYAICTSDDPVQAGLVAAKENGFNNDGTSDIVTINYPPVTGPGTGNPSYVQVKIEAFKPSYFIQLVYPHPLGVTVEAVGFCQPRFDPTTVPGLWAGSTVCNDTVNWTGSNGKIWSSMYSNYQIKFTGSDIHIDPDPDPDLTSHSVIESSNSLDTGNPGNLHFDNDSEAWYNTGTIKNDPLNIDFSLYAPGGAVAVNVPLYKHITVGSKDYNAAQKKWDPKPANWPVLEGLYYVDGDVSIGNNFNFGSQGITIIATGQILDFTTPQNTLVHYYYPIMNPTADGMRYPGIILASPYAAGNCGDKAISSSGPNMILQGVMWAPKATIAVSGASMSLEGAMLGNRIDWSGSQGVFRFNPSLLPPRPPLIKVVE